MLKEKIFVCQPEDKRKLNLTKLECQAPCSVALTSKTHVEVSTDPLVALDKSTFIKTSAKGMPSFSLPMDTFSLFWSILEN